jgi:hypothetical protein
MVIVGRSFERPYGDDQGCHDIDSVGSVVRSRPASVGMDDADDGVTLMGMVGAFN